MEFYMSGNSRKTSKSLGSQASKTLRDPNSSAVAKSLAGSALSQINSAKQTSSKMEDRAAIVLNSKKFSDETKSLAGSVLSQSVKER